MSTTHPPCHCGNPDAYWIGDPHGLRQYACHECHPQKTQHTPGPWETRPTSNPKNGTGWRDIVSTGTTYSPSYVGEALEHDAALIAAAPDLLAALKGAQAALRKALPHLPADDEAVFAGEWLDEIAAALAKAEGHAPCPACNATHDGPVPPYCSEHDGDYSSWLVANNID
jgi:hypothetical protein